MAGRPGNSGIPVITAVVLSYIFTCIFAEGVFRNDFTASMRYFQFEVTPEQESLAELSLRFRFRVPAEAYTIKEVIFHTDSLTVHTDRRLLYYEIPGTESLMGKDYMGKAVLDKTKDWHDVSLVFDKVVATLTVDGVASYEYFGLIPQLKKGEPMYLGTEVAFSSSFKGCLEDFKLNDANLVLQDAKQGNTYTPPEGCSLPPNLMSFNGTESYIDVNIDLIEDRVEQETTILVKFRTMENSEPLMKFTLNTSAVIIIELDDTGKKLKVQYGDPLSEAVLSNDKVEDLTDGNFHELYVEVIRGNFTVEVDDLHMISTTAEIAFGDEQDKVDSIILGGYPGSAGFSGCMSEFMYFDGDKFFNFNTLINTTTDAHSVMFGSCHHKDRCQYNLCAHGSKCTNNEMNGEPYTCHCLTAESGYEGVACLTPIYDPSCEKVTFKEGVENYMIDLDGAGPMEPMNLTCIKESNGQIFTTTQMPANISIDITTYPTNETVEYMESKVQLRALIKRSQECGQSIEYQCFGAPLMKKLSDQGDVPHGFWVDRKSWPHYSWGADTDYMCGNGTGTTCDCDVDIPDGGSIEWKTDIASLSDKDDLPVMRVIFNNGTTDSSSWESKYRVSPLECRHDYNYMEERAITFKKRTAVLSVDVPDGSAPTYFSLEFKTTQSQAFLLHSDIVVLGRKRLHFTLAIETSESLSMTILSEDVAIISKRIPFTNVDFSNDQWHSVYFEINHRLAFLKVDTKKADVWPVSENFFPYLKLYPTQRLFVGGAPDGSNGFVGCIRNLYVGGMFVDLLSKVQEETVDGISTGCMGQCQSNPCLNGGKCNEYYSTFTCDCTSTSYQGCYCGKDVGIHMTNDSSVSYDLTTDAAINTISTMEVLRLGFRTMMETAPLLKLDNTTETIIIELVDGELSVYNGGANASEKFNISGNFGDDEFHTFSFNETGLNLSIRIDSKDAVIIPGLQLPENPTNLTFGRTDMTSDEAGYEGCLFGANYRNRVLLSEVVKDPLPDYVKITGTINAEGSMCSPIGDMPEVIKNHAKELEELKEESRESGAARKPPTINEFKVETQMPTFTMDMSSSIPALSTITLFCPAEGNPAPWTIWKKNLKPVEVCPHLREGDHGDELIIPPEEKYLGLYQCEASNTWGKAMSLLVSFMKPRISSAIVQSETKTSVAGSLLQLECPDVVSSVPPATAEWSDGSSTFSITAGRVFVSATGNLVFLWTLESDTAQYSCSRVNPYLPTSQNKVEVITYDLTVSAAAGTITTEPTILFITTSPQNITEMSNLMLECFASAGNDVAMVSWYKKGQDEPLWTSDEYGRTLHLWNVKESDAGTYECKLNINKTIMAEVTVNVETEPEWESKVEPLTVYQDDDAVFVCKVKSETDYTVVWLLNGELFNGPSTTKQVLGDSNQTLTIKKCSKDTDLKTVVCAVTVRTWRLSSEGYLNVYERMKLETESYSPYVSDTSKDHVISVKVKSDPGATLTFTWYKVGTGTNDTKVSDLKPEMKPLVDILEVTQVTDNHGRLTLRLNQMTAKDRQMFAGMYKCVVSDGVSEVTVTRELVFQSDESSGLSTGAIVGIVVGSILAFTLLAGIIAYLIYDRTKASKRYDP